MAGIGRSLTPRGRFAVRAAILAVFATAAGLVGGLAGNFDEATTTRPEVVTSRTPEPAPGTAEKGQQGKKDKHEQPGRVPSGVTSGIGDDVRLASLDLLVAPSLAGTPDVAALDRVPAASGLRVFSWPGSGALAWRSGRFAEIASGNEYGTRSVVRAGEFQARRILWVTLREVRTGLRISFINASLETGRDTATEAANAAYLQRVRDLTARLTRTSNVVLATRTGARHRVTVPAGNVRPGQVVSLRGQRAVAGGSSARIVLQSSEH